tara:strand:- start:110 stop:1684 length:1575 start_codon:yes stop_codon:yes gene_type:complete
MNHGIILGGVVDYYYDSIKRAPGAHKIATHLRREGWDVEVLDFVQSWTVEELKEFTRQRVSKDTKFLGLSATFSIRFKTLYEFTYWFKEEYPDILIIGGSQAFHNCEGFPLDYMVHGYGELAMSAILSGNVKYTEHKWLNGNSFRRVDATHDYMAARMKNLSTHYEDRDHIQPQEVLTVEFGRGCIFNCHFCTLTYRNIKEDHSRSEDNLYTEMLENYEKWGTTNYSISDETVNDYTEKLERFAGAIKRLPFKPNCAGYIRGDLLVCKPKDWQMIHDIGLNSQFYGIESFHTPSAKAVGKGMHSGRLQDGLLAYKEWARERGHFQAHLSLIAGLPHETLDSLRETKRWIVNNWDGQTSQIMPLWIPDKTRQYEEQSRFAMDPQKYGYHKTTMAECNNNNSPWEDGPRGQFRKLYEGLVKRESNNDEIVYNTEDSTFQEEMSFMNWKSDTLDLYKVLSYLEHEWYDNDFTGGNQPPLPFSYHNWLIDPKHKWEDMSKRMVELPPPVEYAKKFIEDYKIKKLRSTV